MPNMCALQGMSSALDITAIMLLPLAIVIAIYALAVYFVRWRQMSQDNAEVRSMPEVTPVCAFIRSCDDGFQCRLSRPCIEFTSAPHA